MNLTKEILKQNTNAQHIIIPPEYGEVVICRRKWIPSNITSDSKPVRNALLARRMSKEKWIVNEDVSRDAWWESVNGELRFWSDATVESWEHIIIPS